MMTILSMLTTLKKVLLEGYVTGELSWASMLVRMAFTVAIALYICLVFRMVNRNGFFDLSFFLSLFALAVFTSAIVLTIQTNIVISLTMVGALSIVRFRTAIKNPMDLIFLFWSITVGIICGAGYALIGAIASILVTIWIILCFVMPLERETLILAVNACDYIEDQIVDALSGTCRYWKVRARSVNGDNVNFAIEVKTRSPQLLIEKIRGIKDVTSVSLFEHDGDVTV